MKKRLAALLLAVLLLLPLFSGCHGARARSSFAVPAEFDESRSYELTFWAKNDTNKTQTEIYAKAIADFEALYPNIHVNLRLYTDYGKIYNDVITNIQTNTTPNVCITYPDHIATYLTGEDVVTPLDSLFDDPRYGFGGSELRYDGPERSELVPQFLAEGRLNDTAYAIPFMRSTEACYVNRTYVEALGYELPEVLTWDFVWEVAEAATAKDAEGNYLVNGQKVMIPFIYKSTDNMMIQLLRQRGAGYSAADGSIELFNDTTKELLYTVSAHTKTGAFSTFKISSYPANFLNAGQCLFAVDSTAGATWMGSDAPLSDISADSIVRFETVVKTIPQYDPSEPYMISQGPSLCIFNKEDTGEVLASWLFAQYLLTDDVQIPYSQTEGYVPVTTKARETAEYKDYLSRRGEDNNKYYSVKIDATRLLLENTDHTFITPVFNGSASLRNAAGQLIEDVTTSVRRKITVDDEYFVTEKERIISLYHLDSITASGDAKKELGELPGASKALIIILIIVWAGIIAYFTADKIKEAKKHGK